MSTPAEIAACTRILSAIEQPVVVELGAYQGEECDWIHRAAPTAKHIMVEPDPRNIDAIHSRWSRLYRDDFVVQAAIADYIGVAEFHQCEATGARAGEIGSGSIRRPTGHLEYFPWMKFPSIIRVPAITLNSLFAGQHLSRIDLLWADLQGAERDMIAGGGIALSHTRYLFIEAERVEMYEGQATRDELLAMLGQQWSIVEEFEYNILLQNEGFAE